MFHRPSPPQPLSEAVAVFQKLDANNDGAIQSKELMNRLTAIGMAEDCIYALFLSLDENSDGNVSQSEFVAAYQSYRHYFDKLISAPVPKVFMCFIAHFMLVPESDQIHHHGRWVICKSFTSVSSAVE